MFRQVIPKMMQSISPVSNMRMCTNVTDTKLEKTMNQITLLGRTGNEPQLRGNQDHPVVVFSLATHSNYKYMNGKLYEFISQSGDLPIYTEQIAGDFVQRTEWHRICIFKPNLRESVVTHLKKGQRVLVTGKVSYGEFKDEEGQTKSSTAIIADNVIFFQM